MLKAEYFAHQALGAAPQSATVDWSRFNLDGLALEPIGANANDREETILDACTLRVH
jgi:hypothetical protein